MRRLRLVLACALPALLTACATPLLGPECTRFGHDGQICLLPPAALPALEGSRMVKVVHGGREDAFLGVLHIDAKDLRLAGFSLFGTSLFELSFDGTRSTMVPAGGDLKPEILVAMLELALADPKPLQDRLHGLTLMVTDQAGVETRDLSESGHPIAHLERHGASLTDADIRIDIPPAGLTVEMSPIGGTPVQP